MADVGFSQRARAETAAAGSLALALVGGSYPLLMGLGLLYPVMDVLAIVLGSYAMRRGPWRGIAVAGFVLGIIGLLLFLGLAGAAAVTA